LWVPCRRAEPFFPLSPCRQCWTTRPRVLGNVHAARRRGCDPNAIIQSPSPRFVWPLPQQYFDSYLAVLFVGQNFYNTVVLVRSKNAGLGKCLSKKAAGRPHTMP